MNSKHLSKDIQIVSTVYISSEYVGMPMMIITVDALEYATVSYEIMNNSVHEKGTSSGRTHVIYLRCDPDEIYSGEHSVQGGNSDAHVLPQIIKKKEMALKRREALRKIAELKQRQLLPSDNQSKSSRTH